MTKFALLLLSLQVFIVSVSGMTRIGRSVTSYGRERQFFKPQEMRNLRETLRRGDFGLEDNDIGNSHDVYHNKLHGRGITRYGAFPIVMVTRKRTMALKLRQKEKRNNFDNDDAKALGEATARRLDVRRVISR